MTTPDSLIFDMDGTLWDAVQSYAAIWNKTLDDLGSDAPRVTYPKLAPCMGMSLDQIAETLFPDGIPAPTDRFFEVLGENEAYMMRSLGGNLYPGVRQTLHTLKDAGVKLFMVSNCGPAGLPNFVASTGLTEIFTDLLSLGGTGKTKDENIRTLIERYSLKSPMYVGDTRGDQAYTRKAGIPFVWASYGFDPDVKNPDFTLTAFPDILKLFPNLSNN